MTVKAKYDPAAKYVCVKGTIQNKATGDYFTANDGKEFTMKHRTASEVEYLVDVVKAIAPAATVKGKGTK